MAQLGKYNTLTVVKTLEQGMYLDGEEFGEVLLPTKQVPQGLIPGDKLEVFLYKDSEDRPIATTRLPMAEAGDFVVLKVIEINTTGAWLEWGLDKHLLVPYREQKQKMEAGNSYFVHVYLDVESQRLVASSKISKYVDNTPPEYEVGQEVDLIISGKNDLGFAALINKEHTGLLYKNEVFQPLRQGQQIKGYIKKLREDDKIDLMLQKPGYDKIDAIADNILNEIKQNGGVMLIGDKSAPEEIYSAFGISKKDFKKAIGKLYKEQKIFIDPHRIQVK